MNNEFKIKLMEDAKCVEDALKKFLPESEEKYKVVVEAMRYSLLAGGKRLRGAIVLEFYREWCATDRGEEEILPFCCAIEMVHAYSLIHDDLPCMDNDDMRRGKASCHIVYNEATAMLAGDALLTKAFELMIYQTNIPADKIVKAVCVLSKAAGMDGMIGGQILDLAQEGRSVTIQDLEYTDNLKTGALISAAAQMGCIIGGADEHILHQAQIYAKEIGIAFQITDDILDTTSTAEILGKPIGSDKKQHKTTYVSCYGIAEAKKVAAEHLECAKRSLELAGIKNPFLYDLAEYILIREN